MKIGNWISSLTGRTSRRQQDSGQIPVRAAGHTPIDQFSDSDIFLVGFPKSGNTWMQNLVAGVLYGMDTNFLTDKLTQMLVPNVHGTDYYKRVAELTCFKSHHLPRPEYRRVVYLVRDGRDAMVSYFHMLNAVSSESVNIADMVVDGQGVFPCKWHQHIQQWADNPYAAEILTIRYEDLHSNPLGQMKRFCEFANLRRDDELIQRSIDGNSFQQMQLKEAKFGWDNQNWNAQEKFVRRGVVGGFIDEMSPELIHMFEKEAEQQLQLHGYGLQTVAKAG